MRVLILVLFCCGSLQVFFSSFAVCNMENSSSYFEFFVFEHGNDGKTPNTGSDGTAFKYHCIIDGLGTYN